MCTNNLTLASVVLCTNLAFLASATAQTTEPDHSPTGSPTDPQAPLPPDSQTGTPGDRQVSWKLLIPNFINDQEHIWTFPVRAAQGQNWLPTAAVLGATAGLIAFDPTESSYFRRTSAFSGFNNTFTGKATALGTLLAPVSLYAAGWVRKDSKMKSTALLAGEAVADAEVLTTVLKDITSRARPITVAPKGNFSDTWFESRGSVVGGSGSFPSGHTIAAFSLATVVARRYGNHRWVPYVAYGMAAAVGFSRMTLSAHFLSDVFMGATLGYSISRFTVLRQ
jgi:membrane-associated phospholipid phosphatase